VKSWLPPRTLVASAVSAAIGALFLYCSVVGEDRRVASAVLWKLGCALGFFALARQPGVLFERVGR
jgi:integral membrane sensor domain MASE1